MAKQTSVDYEEKFMDELVRRLNKQDRTLERVEKKLEEVHTQVKTTNGRVTDLETVNKERSQATRADDPPQNTKELDPWWRDEKIIKLATLLVVLAIMGLAAFKNITIPGGIL